MKFLKKLFKKQDKVSQTLTVNVMGKDYAIDVGHEAIERRKKELELDIKNAWVNNETDDKFVTNPERKLVGFYGIKSFSENNKYCGVYIYATNSEKKGYLALVDANKKVLCFKKELLRPHACFVSNSGMVAIVDWLNPGVRGSKFYLYNREGSELFSTKLNVNMKDGCLITPDENYAIFETAGGDSASANKLFVIDIRSKKVIHRYSIEYVSKIDFDFSSMKIIMSPAQYGDTIFPDEIRQIN